MIHIKREDGLNVCDFCHRQIIGANVISTSDTVKHCKLVLYSCSDCLNNLESEIAQNCYDTEYVEE